jgi:hypothetical protein
MDNSKVFSIINCNLSVIMTPIALVILLGGSFRFVDLLRFATFDRNFGEYSTLTLPFFILQTMLRIFVSM